MTPKSTRESLVLVHIRRALLHLVLWRGWTERDRIMIRQTAAGVGELSRRYVARRRELKRQEGSPHVHRR